MSCRTQPVGGYEQAAAWQEMHSGNVPDLSLPGASVLPPAASHFAVPSLVHEVVQAG